MNIPSKKQGRKVAGGILIAGTLVLWSLGGCYYDVESELYPGTLPCDSLDISYANQISPIMVDKCLNCHDAGAASGGIVLETYTDVKVQVDNGQLACTVNHQDGCSPMPQNQGILPPCTLQLINIWISEGAPNN